MKVIIFVTAFLASGVLADMPEIGQQFKKECAEKEKVDMAELEKFGSGKLDNPSENIKCYTRCIVESEGFFKNGMFVDAKIEEFLNGNPEKNSLMAVYNECKKIKGSNDCDTNFKVFACMKKPPM